MENVDVVIHSAATLDFELNAKLVININLMGTKRVLSLCSQMQRLRVGFSPCVVFFGAGGFFEKVRQLTNRSLRTSGFCVRFHCVRQFRQIFRPGETLPETRKGG